MDCSYDSRPCNNDTFMNIRILTNGSDSKIIESEIAFEKTHTYANIEYFRIWNKVESNIELDATNLKVIKAFSKKTSVKH